MDIIIALPKDTVDGCANVLCKLNYHDC